MRRKAREGGSVAERPWVLVWQLGRFGAGPRLALELAAALGKHGGLDVRLALPRGAELMRAPGNRATVAYAVETYDGLGGRDGLLMRTPRARAHLAPLLGAVRKAPPAVAIAAMPGLWDPFVVRALGQVGVPIIAIIHDAANHPGDRFEIIQWVERHTIARSAAIVTLSAHVAGRLASRGLIRAHHHLATILHPALTFSDLALPPPTPPAPQGRPLRLLIAGRLTRYKGVPLLLQALEGLPSHGRSGSGGCGWQLRIAGRLRDDRARRAAQAMRAGGAPVDLRNGWLSERDLLRHIDWADVVVCPYIEASQSGIIPAAYGRARPVLATPVGRLPEQVRHGETGLLAEAPTPAALRAALARVLDDPARVTALGQAALALARGPLAWEAIAARLAALIHDVRRERAGAG